MKVGSSNNTVLPQTPAPSQPAKHSLLDGVKNVVNHVKDEFVQEAARAVGYAELAGLKYPVKHYRAEVSPTLTRGSRLENADDYASLKAEGFKGIVDLTAEGTPDEKYAQGAGLNLQRIPIIDNTAPKMDQMKQFLDFVTAPANQPAYVHCEAGQGRTGVAVACYRMAVQHWPLEQALADGAQHGLQLEDQIQFLHQFDQALTAGQIPGYSR